MNTAKIKIMNSRPELTDDEIRQFMDFDDLMSKYKVAAKPNPLQVVLKYGLPAVGITAAVLWVTMTGPFQGQHAAAPADVNVTAEPPDAEIAAKDEEAAVNQSANESPKEEVPATRPVQEPANTGQQTSPESAVPAAPTQKQPAEPVVVETIPPAYQQAEPLDGYSSLYEYFSANLVYPSESLKDSLEGVQTVKFIINTEGKPEDIEVINSLGAPFEREARRVIENMPPWTPAQLNGRPVPSQISLPVTFRISKITTRE